MNVPLVESIKQKIRSLATQEEKTFAELWQKLVLERFLARLSQSPHKELFILKGGTLLSKYLPLGRETKDLDFDVQHLSNTENILKQVLQDICSIDLSDRFQFEISLELRLLYWPYLAIQELLCRLI